MLTLSICYRSTIYRTRYDLDIFAHRLLYYSSWRACSKSRFQAGGSSGCLHGFAETETMAPGAANGLSELTRLRYSRQPLLWFFSESIELERDHGTMPRV